MAVNNISTPTFRRLCVATKAGLLFCVLTALVWGGIELCSFALASRVFFTSIPCPHCSYLRQDETMGWVLTPYAVHRSVSHAKGFDVVYRTNDAFRLDGQEIHASGACDIVLLGDSHVFGFGVPEDQTFSSHLHRLLKEKHAARVPLVLNAGVPGYGPEQYYLRLKSLGALRPNAWVVVYLNPVNDMTNLSAGIDYRYPKPHAFVQHDQLAYTRPLLYDPQIPLRFASDFDGLNRRFNIPPGVSPPMIARIAPWSPTAQLMRAIRAGSLRFRWTPLVTQETMETDCPPEEYERRQQEQVRKDPFHYAARYWPAIADLKTERTTAVDTLRRLFAAMREAVASQNARLLVVIAQECYREQAYWIRLTNILAERLPEYTFQWTLPQENVVQAATQAGVSTLTIRYPPERIEAMFVPCDGHTSGDGFSEVAEQVMEYMDQHGGIGQ